MSAYAAYLYRSQSVLNGMVGACACLDMLLNAGRTGAGAMQQSMLSCVMSVLTPFRMQPDIPL